jgi:DNA-binding MarR family transcriptional regulator
VPALPALPNHYLHMHMIWECDGMTAWSPMYVTDAEVEAVLSACRVMVAVAARSDAAGQVVDPVQFRLLVIISAGGGLSLDELAEAVGVNAATAGRAYDHLVRAGFVDVDGRSTDHQQRLRLTKAGRDLVKAELGRRREALEFILGRLSVARRLEFVAVLREFVTPSNDPTAAIANESKPHRTMNRGLLHSAIVDRAG